MKTGSKAALPAPFYPGKRTQPGRFFKRLADQKELQIMGMLGAVWMLIFVFGPMYGITIAFKNYDIVKPIMSAPWAGFTHFKEFFRDEYFFLILKNTIGISFWKLVIGFPLPIIFAILLNELVSTKFKKVVQTISYMPYFISWVVLGGLMISWLSDSGMITLLLVKAQILKEPVAFLAEPGYFWGLAVISDLWKMLGWNSIIYLAAISSVDQELYEAAYVDGAGRFRRTWHITLSCIRPTILVLFILSTGYMLNTNFDQIFVLKNPLNSDASSVIDIYVYEMGIRTARYSFATAIGLFKSVIALMLLLLTNTVSKRLSDTSLF